MKGFNVPLRADMLIGKAGISSETLGPTVSDSCGCGSL